MNRSIIILTFCAVVVTAIPFKEESTRIHGENGWYVPQADGQLEWLSTAEGEALLAQYEAGERQEETDAKARSSVNAVNFYLYTRANPEDGQEISADSDIISASNFNASNPTRFTIHAWNSNYADDFNSGVRDILLPRGDFNAIAVDWSRGRSLNYASSVAGVKVSGKKVAELIDFLVREHGMSLSTLELIGVSLGTHVAGFTAKQVETGRVPTIIGMDPASPLFSYNKPEKRLSSEDADYVESIQTNCGVLGFTEPIGTAAFYPHGGQLQPGCGADLSGFCSHARSITYYLEALELNDFPTIKCESYEQALKNNCGSTFSSVRLGESVNQFQAKGIYYVPINEEQPYGLGA